MKPYRGDTGFDRRSSILGKASWRRLQAIAIAVLLLVSSLPGLSSEEEGFLFVKSAVGVIVLGTVFLTTMLVVHSWRWMLFAAVLVAIALIDLGIEHMNDVYGRSTDPEPAELRRPSSDVWQNLPRF